MNSSHVRRIAGSVGAGAALSFAWTTQGHGYFSYEWITAKAVIAGVDPHLPVSQLADTFGLVNRLPHAHPRLPGALLLQTPLGLIPFDNAYIFGRVLTVIAGMWLVWLVCRWLGISPGWGLLVYPMILAVGPARAALDTGQYSAFLVAGLIGVTLLTVRDEWSTGIPLGIAVTFKLWPWLVIPALWMAGRKKTAIGAICAFSTLNLLGLLLPSVSARGTLFALNSVGDHWSMSTAHALGLPIWASAALGLTVLALLYLRRSYRLLLASSVPLALLAAPMLWSAYLPVVAVPAIQVWRYWAASMSFPAISVGRPNRAYYGRWRVYRSSHIARETPTTQRLRRPWRASAEAHQFRRTPFRVVSRYEPTVRVDVEDGVP